MPAGKGFEKLITNLLANPPPAAHAAALAEVMVALAGVILKSLPLATKVLHLIFSESNAVRVLGALQPTGSVMVLIVANELSAIWQVDNEKFKLFKSIANGKYVFVFGWMSEG